MTKPPSIADILSGRSGTGDFRTWTVDELRAPNGMTFKGLNIRDDSDQARFTQFIKDAASFTAPASLGPATATDGQDDSAGVPIAETMEKWSQTLPDKTPSKKKTKGAKLKAVRDFIAYLEALPRKARPSALNRVTSRHCSDWQIFLVGTGLDPRTIENRFVFLAGFIKWAQASGYYPLGENPARGLASVSKADKRKANMANGAQQFLPEQLDCIFGSANFGRLPQDADRWLPLICLYTGARGNEIGRLELADLYIDDYGVPVFDFNLRGDGKSIKCVSSVRKTPIHPDLIALGLLERVERLKGDNESKLFPGLTFDAQNGPANAPMRAFGRYLRLIEVVARGNGTVGIHSFRDTVLNRLKVNGVPRDVREEYTGHEISDRPEHSSAYEDPFSTINLAGTCHPALSFGLDIQLLRALVR